MLLMQMQSNGSTATNDESEAELCGTAADDDDDKSLLPPCM